MPNFDGQEVGRISIRVVPDLDRFRSELVRELKSIEDSVRAKIKVKADMKGFREEVTAKTRNLPDAKVHVKTDKDEFRRLLDEVRRAARRADTKIGIDFKDEEAQAELLSSIARLKAIAATQKIKLDIDVDEDWIRRTVQGRFSRAMSKIKMPSFGSGINMAGWGVIFAGIAMLAGPVFGLLTTALLALPGLVTAVVAPVGALLLGLDGLTDAAKTLEKPFKSLKSTMSDAARSAFTPVFETLKGVFPALERSLPAVTKGMGDIAQSVADMLASPASLAKLDAIFQNIGSALTQAGPGMANFTDGMLTLAQKFTEKMPDLSDWFNGAGKSFVNWVNGIVEDGSLSTALDGLGGTLKTLMEGVGGILEKGFDFMRDPANIEDFNAGLESLGNALESIVDLSNTINSMGDMFKGMFPELSPGGFWDDITKPFTSENAPWRKWFGGDDAAEKAKEQGGYLADNAFKGFVESAEAKNKSIADVMLPSADDVKKGPGGLGPFDQILEDTKQKAAETKKQVAETKLAISDVGEQTSKGIPAVDPQQAKTAVSELQGLATQANQVASEAAAAFGKIGPAAEEAWDAVRKGAKQAGSDMIAEVSSWEGKIKSATAGLYSAGFSSGQNIGKGMAAGIRAQISEVKAAAADLASAASSASKTELKEKSPSRVFHEIGSFAGQGLADGLHESTDGVVDRARALAQKLTDGTNKGLAGMNTGLKDQLGQTLAQLELRRKQLQVQYNEAGDEGQKASLRGQMDQIRALKDKLKLQQAQLGYEQKYGDQIDKNKQMLGESLNKMVDIGQSFAMANANQFMSDVGISGQGAIPQIANAGLGWLNGMLSQAITGGLGGGTTIQVNSVDEALAAKQTIANKQALRYKGR